MNGSATTGTRHSQMIAAGRGVKPTTDDYCLAYQLLENGVTMPNNNLSIRLVISTYNKRNDTDRHARLVDRYHIEAIKFEIFNYQLDVENVNFKTI